MKIRKIVNEDAKKLLDLLFATKHFDSFLKDDEDKLLKRTSDNVKSVLNDGSHLMLVAEEEGKLIGYLSAHFNPYLMFDGPECYITELFIDDEQKGKGVGAKLLEEIKKEANARGCYRMSLINLNYAESYKRNFYIKNGFEERTTAANFIIHMKPGPVLG